MYAYLREAAEAKFLRLANREALIRLGQPQHQRAVGASAGAGLVGHGAWVAEGVDHPRLVLPLRTTARTRGQGGRPPLPLRRYKRACVDIIASHRMNEISLPLRSATSQIMNCFGVSDLVTLTSDLTSNRRG